MGHAVCWVRSLDMQLAVPGYPVVQPSVITAGWIQEASFGAVPHGNTVPDETTCPLRFCCGAHCLMLFMLLFRAWCSSSSAAPSLLALFAAYTPPKFPPLSSTGTFQLSDVVSYYCSRTSPVWAGTQLHSGFIHAICEFEGRFSSWTLSVFLSV